METLKFDKRFKVRVAGDSNSASHAFCLGYKPDERWVKSVKLLHTPVSDSWAGHAGEGALKERALSIGWGKGGVAFG